MSTYIHMRYTWLTREADFSFLYNRLNLICRALSAIPMAHKADVSASLQSSQSRIAIWESCTRCCDVILRVNDNMIIMQDVAMKCDLFCHNISWNTPLRARKHSFLQQAQRTWLVCESMVSAAWEYDRLPLLLEHAARHSVYWPMSFLVFLATIESSPACPTTTPRWVQAEWARVQSRSGKHTLSRITRSDSQGTNCLQTGWVQKWQCVELQSRRHRRSRTVRSCCRHGKIQQLHWVSGTNTAKLRNFAVG